METIWTLGHSTLPLEAFFALLKSAKIESVADVRRYPASRRHPQFNAATLAQALAGEGMRYRAYTELGGRRTPRSDSSNTRWRNASFRGYADYMETEAFEAALSRLTAEAMEARTAVMCAEAPWWRCHRALIADTLKARGIEVLHIMAKGQVVAHPYTPVASVVDGRPYYGPSRDLLDA
jgi:uncharacterized protein (DUF488 family)